MCCHLIFVLFSYGIETFVIGMGHFFCLSIMILRGSYCPYGVYFSTGTISKRVFMTDCVLNIESWAFIKMLYNICGFLLGFGLNFNSTNLDPIIFVHSKFVPMTLCSIFCTNTIFKEVYCFICSRRKVAAVRYRMICLVLRTDAKNKYEIFI